MTRIRTWSDATGLLDALTDYERSTGWAYDAKAFGLDRMRSLLAAAGDPQRACRCVIVAGTKGKGSTAAMLAAILEAGDHPTGLYTSPHLVDWTERIRIRGADAGRPALARWLDRVAGPVTDLAARGEEWRPTTFEAVTAAALLGFAEAGVRTAVLEVGLGGRLDAVNVVDAAAVAITPIGFDHVDQLGNTLAAIAGEKAGVIKSGAPVVSTLAQPPEALGVIEGAARRARAPLLLAGSDAAVAGEPRADRNGTVATIRTARGAWADVRVGLAGRHQLDNALMAVLLALALEPAWPEAAVRRGLGAVRWPGRLQRLAGEPTVLLDGAHTVESAAALAAALRDLYAPARCGLVLGMLRGKDHAGVVAALAPLADRIYCPALRHPRALPAAELAALVGRAGGRASVHPDAGAALAAACREHGGTQELTLVSGSLSLVGEALVWRGSPAGGAQED